MKKVILFESFIGEGKTLSIDDMMAWLEQHIDGVRTSNEFDGTPGGIWICGECGDEFKNRRIYDYYNDSKAYEMGVLSIWEKEVNKRGWYSEWYDAGTVMIWPN